MNYRDLLLRRRAVANMIRISNRHKNVFRWSVTETEAHRDRKYRVCVALQEKGHEYYTEAIFTNGLRADVVDADAMTIYEVVDTEKAPSIEQKRASYPFPIRTVDANEPWNEKMLQ